MIRRSTFCPLALAAVLVLVAAPVVSATDAPEAANDPAPAASEPAAEPAAEIGAATVTCEVDCGTTVKSCSGSWCTAMERSCSGEPGYVECDGVRISCGSCDCEEGVSEQRAEGCCCTITPRKTLWRTFECIDGYWERTQWYTCSGACSPKAHCDIQN